MASLQQTIPVDGALEPLTPVILPPNESARHERELALAMTEPLVRNIAITGGYGAGKSSLIMTFKERHPGFKYALVSLATFRKEGEVADSAGERDKHEVALKPEGAADSVNNEEVTKPDVAALINRIEETIVQQLLYAVPAEKLPRTRLKRIVRPSPWRSAVATALIVLGAITALRLYLVTAFPPRTMQMDWLTRTLEWIPSSLALSIAMILGTYATYLIVRPLSLITIDGWSIKGGKIETMQHGSVLHKNVDEIVYCFQSSDIDVVVVEDLDRFGIQDVFFRLREINAIINESPRIKRTVRFIYALNDELFAAGEKTKFFDVVLPVVPVINKENSHAKMLERLEARMFGEESYAQKLDPELIETVCYRVDDMRLVKNIVNEFDVFARVLMTGLRLDWNKLFAMIVVKNLHSDQYWQLTKRSGFLYHLIAGYADWRSGQAAEIRKKMAALERLLQRKKEDAARSKVELRMMAWYAAQMKSEVQVAPTFMESALGSHSLTQFVEDDVFDGIAASKRPQSFQNANHHRFPGPFQLADILDEMDYAERVLAVAADVDAIQSELAAHTKQLQQLQNMSLAQGMRSGYQELRREDLAAYETIKYLLVSGHLDQDYPDYLGHFYGRLIGREDMNLLLALRQGDACDVGTRIEDVEKLLRKLRMEHIDQGRGIIADLISHLCQGYVASSAPLHMAYLTKIFEDAEAYPERFAEAAGMLVNRGEGGALINAVFSLRPVLIAVAIGKRGLPDDDSRQAFLASLLGTLTLQQLQSLGEVGASVAASLRSLTRVARLVPTISAKADGWRWLKARNVRFESVGATTSIEDLTVLVQADVLAPSLAMLWLVAGVDPGTAESDVSLTVDCLLQTPIDGGVSFLKKHAFEVVDAVLEQPGALGESTGSVLQVLEWLGDDDTLASPFFDRTSCAFASIQDIPETLWERGIADDRFVDVAEAVRVFDGSLYHRDDERGDDDVRMRATLSAYVARHVDELSRTLWGGGATDHPLQGWLLAETELSDDVAVRLLSKTLISDPRLIAGVTQAARLQQLAEAGCIALSAPMVDAIIPLPVAVQVPYFKGHWDQIRETALVSLLPYETAERLYLGGGMALAEALRIFSAFDTATSTVTLSVAVLEKLATDASAADVGFGSTLSAIAAQRIAEGELRKTSLEELLPHAIPEMSWAAITKAFQVLGGGLAKMRPNRKFSLDRSPHVDRIVTALERCDAFSSLLRDVNQTTGRVRRGAAQ